jgi:hypothetical protein
VGRVVSSTINAEPMDWFRIESRDRNISTLASRRPIEPSAVLTNDLPESASDGSGVVSVSSEHFPVRDPGTRFITQAKDTLVACESYKHWSF